MWKKQVNLEFKIAVLKFINIQRILFLIFYIFSVKKYNEQNALVQFDFAVDRVLNYEVFSLIITRDQIQSVPKLEIISPGVEFWNYNCVATTWDYGNKIVKQDVAFLSADECQQKINQKNLICIDKELSSNANIIVGECFEMS